MYSKNNTMPRALGSLIEDIFANGVNKVWGEDSVAGRGDVPVNIQETETSYELHLAAPGLNKEDFKLNIDRNVLTISFDQKEEESEQTGKWLRNEFKAKSFKRSFTLNDKIDTSGISARYNAGILHVTLAKKEQAGTATQEINVQ